MLYKESKYFGKPISSQVESNFQVISYSILSLKASICLLFRRQVFGYQTTPRNRIIELEQTDDWMSALLEYGSIQFTCPPDRVNPSFTPSIVVTSKSDGDMQGMGSEKGKEKEDKLEISVIDMTTDISVDEEKAASSIKKLSVKNEKEIRESGGGYDGKRIRVDEIGDDYIKEENEKSFSDALKDCSELERGRLRCLLELGHLDAVVDQAMGITLRAPQLESTLIPLGIEAAWKLMKWDDLDVFLSRIDGPSTFNSTPQTHEICYGNGAYTKNISSSSSRGTNRGDRGRLGISILPEDGFQVSVGRLMRSMVHRDADSFWSELADARSQVNVATFIFPCPRFMHAFIHPPCRPFNRLPSNFFNHLLPSKPPSAYR